VFYDVIYHSYGIVPALANPAYYTCKLTSAVITTLMTGAVGQVVLRGGQYSGVAVRLRYGLGAGAAAVAVVGHSRLQQPVLAFSAVVDGPLSGCVCCGMQQ
jgi:hypothetical protein